MKIHRVGTWIEHFELPRPDTIAFRTVDSMRNGIVRAETARTARWGAAPGLGAILRG